MRVYDLEETERQTTRVRRHLDMKMPEAAANEFMGFITEQNVFEKPVPPDHITVLSDYFRQWAFLVSLPVGQVEIVWNIWKDSITVDTPIVGTGDKEDTKRDPEPTSGSTG
tara:strand:- start:13256 stop:13588 length:333 start_codon:yes stop_codon:yes gene_type:complete